jgi:hypothetical protein
LRDAESGRPYSLAGDLRHYDGEQKLDAVLPNIAQQVKAAKLVAELILELVDSKRDRMGIFINYALPNSLAALLLVLCKPCFVLLRRARCEDVATEDLDATNQNRSILVEEGVELWITLERLASSWIRPLNFELRRFPLVADLKVT